jgi:hypothetical protein
MAIRSRLDYYAASADPSRATLGSDDPNANPVQQGVFRSRRSIDEMRRRPEALRTGYGNIRVVGAGQPYQSGMGKPLIEREDVVTREDGS